MHLMFAVKVFLLFVKSFLHLCFKRLQLKTKILIARNVDDDNRPSAYFVLQTFSLFKASHVSIEPFKLKNRLSLPALEKIKENNLEMMTSKGKTKCKRDMKEERFRCVKSFSQWEQAQINEAPLTEQELNRSAPRDRFEELEHFNNN